MLWSVRRTRPGNCRQSLCCACSGSSCENRDSWKKLQGFVKSGVAPFKYPRAIEFLSELPKTQTGKIQRSILRRRAAELI